jgi:cytochrome c oxidase assembly factor CtaG
MTMATSHWSANAAALAVVAVVAAVHLRGTRAVARDARRRGETTPSGLAREAAVFYAGLLVALLALVSPVGYWSQRFIWVRSMQDLLLANVAPALVVLGGPWLALRRGLRFGAAAPRAGPGRSSAPALDADPGWARGPVLAVIAFNVVWVGWHIPALYDAALRHSAVYAAEVVSYLGLGVLLWLQLIGSRPVSPALTPLRRVTLLAGTITVGTLLGMVLVFGYGLAYPGYLPGHQLQSVVYDQQTGGAVLWVLMLPAYIITGIALLIRWLKDEESQALTAGLDRLLKPPKSAWPSRPGLR